MSEPAATTVCFIAGCDKAAVGEVTVWPQPPGTLKGNEPPVAKVVPLCAEHLEAAQIKSEDFFKSIPSKPRFSGVRLAEESAGTEAWNSSLNLRAPPRNLLQTRHLVQEVTRATGAPFRK